jgi:hypothetical protein
VLNFVEIGRKVDKALFLFAFSTNEIAISEETHANNDSVSSLNGGVGGDVFQQLTAVGLSNTNIMTVGAIGETTRQGDGLFRR